MSGASWTTRCWTTRSRGTCRVRRGRKRAKPFLLDSPGNAPTVTAIALTKRASLRRAAGPCGLSPPQRSVRLLHPPFPHVAELAQFRPPSGLARLLVILALSQFLRDAAALQ